MNKIIWDRSGFADNRGINREKDPRLRFIHDDFLSCKKIICTPLDKFREIGSLVNREKIKEGPKNTMGVTTLVLKIFNFFLEVSIASFNKMVS